jgi:hypothetical protein
LTSARKFGGLEGVPRQGLGGTLHARYSSGPSARVEETREEGRREMKKPRLTLQEHQEIGAALKAFRNERLIHYSALIQNATSKNSPQSMAARKALRAVDELRNVMDRLVYEDYADAPMGIYYGTEDGAKQ